MNIILSGDLSPTIFESYRNILRVFSYAEHICVVWFKNQKSMYDMWDEVKPAIYIADSINEKETKICAEYGTKFIKTVPLLFADIFQYRKINISDIDEKFFHADNTCIINHEEKEIDSIRNYLNKGLSFKLFSQHKYMQTEYCGFIPEQMYCAALSCADKLIASNFLNMYNFLLINPNTIYPFYSETESYSRDAVMDRHTSFTGAKQLIEDNKLQDLCEMDVDKLYAKFRNENSI